MDWKVMNDPENIENRNAGNCGDLVKHTVYLATLRFLLAREPWSKELVLRECHAGRGIYQIPDGDPRTRLLSDLYAEPPDDEPVLLHDAEKNTLRALKCWPSGNSIQWYAGSALINAYALAQRKRSSHRIEFYELDHKTRRILRGVVTDAARELRLPSCAVAEDEAHSAFDGEAYIERHISGWGKEDVVLLDPFAMWRQQKDQTKRDHFLRIITNLIGRGDDAPSLILFWTWGQAFLAAEGDLNGTAKSVNNGYRELRDKLHNAGFHFVLVKWRWGLQFAMWVIVPRALLSAVRDEIDSQGRRLADHLLRHGNGGKLEHPSIKETID